MFLLREWRNWQTRTFEGRVVNTVRVQFPSPAPKNSESNQIRSFFIDKNLCFILFVILTIRICLILRDCQSRR